MENNYTLLGVAPEASADEIRRAYRRRARELHPDVRPGPEAEALMRRLNAARETLLDPGSRRAYDQRLCPAPPVQYSPATASTSMRP